MQMPMKMERFNLAYVGAIAAQVGINSSKPDVDDDSVDICFIGKGFPGLIRDPQINFQLKCTHQDLRVGENIRFPLSRKNYDDLRDIRLGTPRYLAVLEVPENCNDWVRHLTAGSLLSSMCYWASLRGHPDIDQGTITVSVPLIQRLTGESLHSLLTHASNRTQP
jgi:hypothetical protein